MSKFCSLYSSSSGNSVYIGHSGGGILIDIGCSAKRTRETLDDIGVDSSEIGAVFVTHEHSDHIAGVRVFASKRHLPVYATAGTLEGMKDAGALDGSFRADVIPASGVEAAGMFVRPFRTSHDSNESCGYTVEMPDGSRLAVATDLGTMTDEVLGAIVGCRIILLESNHDVRMLQANPRYPYPLKRRILSDVGHLSNDACSQAASALVESGTTHILLGHLSKENNIPDLAYRCTSDALSQAGMVEGRDYILGVAGVGAPKPIAF